MGSPHHNYEASPAIWDHTCHPTQVNSFRHNPSDTGRYSMYLPRRDGRLSWPWCLLYTEIVYLSAVTHPGTDHLIATW